MFPMNRYKYIIDENKKLVVAVSTYCGRKVYGRAFCAEKDKFDPEIGKMLAAARCDQMVCEKRAKRAAEKLGWVDHDLDWILELREKMLDYYMTSNEELEAANARLADLEGRLCK